MRNRGNIFVFGLSMAVALWFIYGFVFFYLGGEPGRFGIFTPCWQWLTMHILAGSVVILLGPLQFWLARNRCTSTLHRVLGACYAAAVSVGGTATFYLGFHTDFGWVFGMRMIGIGCAWIMTTGLA